MRDLPDQRPTGVTSIVFTTVVAAILLSLLWSTTDTVEGLWASTRGFELWELDDILLGIALAPTAGLIVAIVQIRQLNRRLKIMESGGLPVRTAPGTAHRVPGIETIVKCSYCAKFKAENNAWLSEDDYLSHRCNATVVAGVCPACRQGTPSKPV